MNFVNLDFISYFMKSSCSLAVPFLDQFILHMSLPVLLLVAALVAHVSSRCCLRNPEKLKRGNELKYQILLLGVLFLYPGLATKIFNVFNCKIINGIDGKVLAADFAIKCYEEKHSTYLIVAVAFLLVYILGIPLAMFIVLWRNRNHLHFEHESEELTEKHLAMKARLGGLYLQYEPKYWVRGIDHIYCSLNFFFGNLHFSFFFLSFFL